MHRYLILIVLFAAGCGSNPSNKTPNPEKEAGVKKTELPASTLEEFAQSIVTLFAAHDANQFVAFAYLAKEELLDFAPKLVPADRLDKVINQIEAGFDQEQKANRDCFAKVRKELAGDGCDWNQAKFVRAEYEITKEEEFSAARSVGVTLSAGAQTYKFVMRDCILINGRWFTFEGIHAVTEERVHARKAKAKESQDDHDHGTEEGSKK